MSLMTCGLASDGVVAAVIPFATIPYLTVFATDLIEEKFEYVTKEVGFTSEIPVVEFDINVIKIEECSWPAA